MINRTDAHYEQVARADRQPVRIVLAGCGAVTRLYYAPALARLQRDGSIKVIAIFDPDDGAIATVHNTLPAAVAARCFKDLLALGANVAIVASPPRFHADQTIEALRAGLHVLCEKPLATTSQDAAQIVAAADALGLSAAVALVRRQFPSTRSIKDILDSGIIGQLRAVTCFEGGPFDWPVASPRYFDRNESGGGVLQDIGTHCLDLLSWWLGTPVGIDYADDAIGGIEANCLLRLQYNGFEACVRLSRDWARPNNYHFEGDHGWLSWTVNDIETVEVGFNKAKMSGRLSPWGSSDEVPDFIGCFAVQIKSFVNSIQTGAPPPVPARAGRDVLALIDRCYATRRLIEMPWMSPEERACAVEFDQSAA